MANIETGVDKLVRLVAKEKKIEINSAASKLGVSPAVIQEWAEFLEEEGIVGLEYSLSKVFVVEKKLSKVEVEKKGKEYEGKKEAFVRRVDTALKQLEDETSGFESIKKQYDSLKNSLGGEIDTVKEEIDHLKHYEDIKKTIDHDITKQKEEYQKTLEEIKTKVAQEEKRYGKIVDEITDETKKIDMQKTEFSDIKHEEEDLTHRLTALQDILKSIQTRVQDQAQAITVHEQRLQTLRDLSDALRSDLVEKRRKEIEPMLKISSDQTARIQRVQDEILAKVKGRQETIEKFEEQSKTVSERFSVFFEKRAQTEQMIKDLETLKQGMRTELTSLINKAKAFDITVHGADINTHIKQLETTFKEFDQKKNTFSSKLERLKSLIAGHTPEKTTPSEQPKRKVVKKAVKKKKR